MVFLFSLINISFTLFFFLFWKFFESIIFWMLSIIYIVYFSKILTFFLNKEEIKDVTIPLKKNFFSMKTVIEFFKKWSYYTSFFFFYSSLYWFIYSINLLYNFSSFSLIFQYISFFISFTITGIFFIFLSRKHETISLIFRSNGIFFTLLYSFFLLFYLIKNISPDLIFIINSFFFIGILLGILLFDRFLKKENSFIYILFLFYIFLMGVFYIALIFPSIYLWNVFLWVTSFYMIIYTFLFPSLTYFYNYRYISQLIGIVLGYIISISLGFTLLFESLSLYYLSILGISILYHYFVYKLFKNRISYIIFLLTFIFLYVKIFILLSLSSIIPYIIFIFLLPFLFIGSSYFIIIKQIKDTYILHSIGISFSIISLIYYFIEVGSFFNILSLSTILFFESILLFISYLRFKK